VLEVVDDLQDSGQRDHGRRGDHDVHTDGLTVASFQARTTTGKQGQREQ